MDHHLQEMLTTTFTYFAIATVAGVVIIYGLIHFFTRGSRQH